MAEYKTPEFHPAFEEYCEAIYELHEDDVEVIQARIADRLMVSRPAVSEMIKRLEAEGLVADRPQRHQRSRRTASAWPSGSCAATAWPSASSPTSSGCRGRTPTRRPASGSTSSPSRSRQAIVRVLGDPTTCPHGNPIPGRRLRRAGVGAAERGRSSAAASRSAASPRSSSSRPGLLEFLEEADVVPGRAGTITAASPDGTTTVEIDGRHVGIGAFASPAHPRHRLTRVSWRTSGSGRSCTSTRRFVARVRAT